MKIFKKILLAFTAIIVLSAIGGYIYFNKKFTPPENYIQVKGTSEEIPMKWISDESNPNVALLLPVKLEGISQEFYMQLDFGSPITVFYSNALNSIQLKFSRQISFQNDSQLISLKFYLAQMEISSDKFKILKYGETIDCEPEAVNII